MGLTTKKTGLPPSLDIPLKVTTKFRRYVIT